MTARRIHGARKQGGGAIGSADPPDPALVEIRALASERDGFSIGLRHPGHDNVDAAAQSSVGKPALISLKTSLRLLPASTTASTIFCLPVLGKKSRLPGSREAGSTSLLRPSRFRNLAERLLVSDNEVCARNSEHVGMFQLTELAVDVLT